MSYLVAMHFYTRLTRPMPVTLRCGTIPQLNS
jgi:hypothetical protein